MNFPHLQVQVKDEHTDELLEANTALEGKDDKGEVIEEKKWLST